LLAWAEIKQIRWLDPADLPTHIGRR